MASDQDKLQEHLEQLQTQLDTLRRRDPVVAAALETALGEFKALLAGGMAPAEHRSLVDRIGEIVLKYEASHPQLAGNLGAVVDALARMGI